MAERLKPFLSFLKSAVLIDLALGAVVAVAAWLGGWRTRCDYTNAPTIAGAAVGCIGAASAFSGRGLARGAEQQCGRTASMDRIQDLTRQAQQDLTQTYGYTMGRAIMGAMLITAGIIIQLLFT